MSNVLSPSDLLEMVSEMDSDELDELKEVIKVRQRHLTDAFRLDLSVGDMVRFQGKKTGRNKGLWEGKIVKKNPKTCKINAEQVSTGRTAVWTVYYQNLEKVED